jgi:pseudaminic acid synthase
MKGFIEINGRLIGPGKPVYLIAEMSANHNQDFDQAVKIIRAAKEAGADAIKLQTYTPDTMTIPVKNEFFQIGKGTIWEGRHLYDLYAEAYTPWEWHPKLKEIAAGLGLDFFSTPFDDSSVDFLEQLGVPAYKIASFELVDLPLLRRVARTGKPIIMSTGMATLGEIGEAVGTLKEAGAQELALLKCTSAYPATAEDAHLRTIPHLAEAFGVPVGLSDHTLGIGVPVAAAALGACIIEKHFTLSRSIPGPDSAFSLEPAEFKSMVEAVRVTEKALGEVHYAPSAKEIASRVFRRSLFVVRDMRAGEAFTKENVRSIRPAYGLHTRHLQEILGRLAARDIRKGTPLSWDLISSDQN